MNVQRLLIVISALVMLSACGSAEKYMSATGIKASGFVGKPFTEVVKEYGKPSRIQDSAQDPNLAMMIYDGKRITYTVKDAVGGYTEMTPNGPVQTNVYRQREVTTGCSTIFWVDKKDFHIKVFDWTGNCL